MDQNTLEALQKTVEKAYSEAKDRDSFLKNLSVGLKKLRADRVIAEFNIEEVDENGLILTIRENDGSEHRFGLAV